MAMASSVFKRCFTRGRKLVDAGSVVTVSASEWIAEKHIVKREPDGRIRCSCAGYKSKNICPHVAAVAITRGLIAGARLRGDLRISTWFSFNIPGADNDRVGNTSSG